MRKRSTWSRVLVFNLVLLGAGVIVLELVFGHWFSPNLTDRLNLSTRRSKPEGWPRV